MRCLFVADLHYSLSKFDWLLKAAPEYDLVVLAGDALDLASSVDFRAQTLVVRKYLQRLSRVTRLLVCSGNHDLDSRSPEGEKICRWIGELREPNLAKDGDSLVIGDTLFTICPWWDGPVVRERLVAQLEADARRRRGLRWVWIHHAPPLDSPTSSSGHQSRGDVDLALWIGEHNPDIVVSGHIHQAPFVQDGSWADRIGATWVFNTGFQFGAPPAFVALETRIGEALWISAMDVQTVRLDAPLQRPIPSALSIPEWFDQKSSGRPKVESAPVGIAKDMAADVADKTVGLEPT
jgi:Icc-related predicted phosphoesterase